MDGCQYSYETKFTIDLIKQKLGVSVIYVNPDNTAFKNIFKSNILYLLFLI